MNGQVILQENITAEPELHELCMHLTQHRWVIPLKPYHNLALKTLVWKISQICEISANLWSIGQQNSSFRLDMTQNSFVRFGWNHSDDNIAGHICFLDASDKIAINALLLNHKFVGEAQVRRHDTLTVHVVEGALFITVSCLHLWTNSTAFEIYTFHTMTTSFKDENKVWPDTVKRQFWSNDVYCECEDVWFRIFYFLVIM